ncbi:multicopper oxidase family protein [Nocardioides sp.]|uniref:multicopper oxidase family protein n=1 Tax=Nocardioides sp. TaxID=35761 RepID=UPI0019B64D88|nr:multicopper oxidase family protein [Nocardioides sp.]MBC7277530.1 multicopper oxidase family protein [Nocardioides sp.]
MTGMARGFTGCAVDNGGAATTTESSAGRIQASTAELPEPFTLPFRVPAVLKPVRQDDTTDYYEITQRVADAEIIPGATTEIWGYNGTFPGPTIVSERGRQVVVRHRNELPVPTVVHLHGGVTAPEHDGFPTDLVVPSGWDATRDEGKGAHEGHTPGSGSPAEVTEVERDYVYPLDQPAATLWYHDHRMDFTGPQVWRGLAGFHIHHDAEEEALGLPTGDRDVPLMIADRTFAGDGSMPYPALDPALRDQPGVTDEFHSGVLGDCILVNGVPWPVMEVAAVRYRFRILNASNARRYRLRLDDGPSFVQVGSDAGLLDAPATHDELDVAQAERFDVVIDFSDHSVGDEITMVNEHGDNSTEMVMRFVVTREEEDDSRVPDRLVDLERLSTDDVKVEREFVFERTSEDGTMMWTVNGEPWSPDSVAARTVHATVERWRFRAKNVEHPIHVHLSPFQIIERDGNEPGPFDRGWKDTVNLGNGGRADVLVRFDGFRGKYVFHCHNLEHEDMMMMGNFEVV